MLGVVKHCHLSPISVSPLLCTGIPVFDPTRDSVSQRLLRGIPWRHQVHLAHRIDKATQGILICAFTSVMMGLRDE